MRPFEVGEELISCLAKDRVDYCLLCWTDDQGAQGSVWQAKVPQPKKGKKQRFVDLFDRGLELLKNYLEAGDPKAYMLALYLQRQGALHRLPMHRSKKEIALFEVTETEETLAVPINEPAVPKTIEEDLMRALTGGV